MMLEEQYGYTKDQTQNFSSLYISGRRDRLYPGGTAGQVALRCGLDGAPGADGGVHRLLTALRAIASMLPASGLLLASLLAIGFGSLGRFPTYYGFTQELSMRQMGKITGVLSFLT
jgi:ACS family hexuronate transporter-like MFS transporter